MKEDIEHGAVGMAAFVMVSAVLNRLKLRGILASEDIAEILDHCLLLMEQSGLDQRAKTDAHGLIDVVRRGYSQEEGGA